MIEFSTQGANRDRRDGPLWGTIDHDLTLNLIETTPTTTNGCT
jgi:hypothetical protein